MCVYMYQCVCVWSFDTSPSGKAAIRLRLLKVQANSCQMNAKANGQGVISGGMAKGFGVEMKKAHPSSNSSS